MKRLILISSLLVSAAAFAQTPIEETILPFPPAGAKAKPRAQVYAEKCPGVNMEPIEAGNISPCRAADDADIPKSETEAYVSFVTGPRKTVSQGSNVQVIGLSDNTVSAPPALRPATTMDRPEEGTGNQ